MKTITLIEFNPQSSDDTFDAVQKARQLLKENSPVELRPTANLFKDDCVARLNSNGFVYDKEKGAFVYCKFA